MKPVFTIRKAIVSDFEELNFLMESLGYKIEKFENQKRRGIFETILLNEYQEVYVIAENDVNKIHAMISYSVLPQLRLAGLKMEIDELVVCPNRRGDGLGCKLVQFVIDRARDQGVRKIIVSNSRERESYKRSFYQKLGFREKNSAFFDLTLD